MTYILDTNICIYWLKGDRNIEAKASLIKEGNVIDDADILIAACALVEGTTLVTNNEKHFKLIRGLKIENWVST